MGAEGPFELEKSEPPSSGLRPDDRDLSRSARFRPFFELKDEQLTTNSSFYCFLNSWLEDLSLSPYLHHSTEFCLYLISSTFIRSCCSLCDDLAFVSRSNKKVTPGGNLLGKMQSRNHPSFWPLIVEQPLVISVSGNLRRHCT